MSSRDPGELGIYGFRNRADHSYSKLTTADSTSVNVQRVWDVASQHGKESILVGVPQTYPVRPIQGVTVSDFLTPATTSAFTYPAILKQEVLKQFPEYAFDVKDFRTDDKDLLRQRLSDVTAVQYQLFKGLLTSRAWDFAMFVNMGTDRVHHGFWRYHDPAHRLYTAGNRYEQVIRDYYKQVDQHIGDLLAVIPDDVTVLVVSDHGVTRMDGAICINEWLWRNGWLVLNTPPAHGQITRFEDASINWAETRAWSTGGYYGRIFMNVQGREPQGSIPATDYERVRDELATALKGIPAADGTPIHTQTFKPQDIYRAVNGVAPDLLAYFGDLHWRCIGSLGHESVYTLENDTGPDDANHAPEGMFIFHEPNTAGRGAVMGHQLMDIAPTVLSRLKLPILAGMQGQIIG